MPKPMKYRDLIRRLRKHNCTWRDAKGSHEMWSCCEQHTVPVKVETEVSSGVVGDVISKLQCLPKGWWTT